MGFAIRPAVSPADFEAFGTLVAAYLGWLRERYADDRAFIDDVLAHQDIDAELASLARTYGPPAGLTLLATSDDATVVGCGAYRRLGDGSCEMKRLFVSRDMPARGAGRALSEALIAAARDEGLRLMRLDTGHRFTEAIALYRSLGFRDCAPHRPYPPELARHLHFMERQLDVDRD